MKVLQPELTEGSYSEVFLLNENRINTHAVNRRTKSLEEILRASLEQSDFGFHTLSQVSVCPKGHVPSGQPCSPL